MPLTSARDRRALGRGAIVIAALVIVAKVVPPLREVRGELTTAIAATTREAAALDHKNRELRALNALAQTRSMRERQAILDGAFVGSSPTDAAASAAQYVSGLAQVAGANILSVLPASDSAFNASLAAIEIRMQLSVNVVGLFALIDELAQAPRVTQVSSLTVSARDPSAAPDVQDAVRVELVVRALGREVPSSVQ